MGTLSTQDHMILDRVDRYLSAALQLKQWWESVNRANAYADRFELGLTFNRPDTGFGFFDATSVDGRKMAIMGNFQTMLYDQPKAPSEQRYETARWTQDQLREFVLRYFMRVSDFRQPQVALEESPPPPSPYLRPVSWCLPSDAQRVGFGFSQLYYKRADTGKVGQFADDERFAIVDLREIGPTYKWIVAKVRIFDFNFSYQPFGVDGPQWILPLSEASHLVLSRELISNQDAPRPGVLGRYGVGYAFIKEPTAGFLTYGPGQFDAAIELINFEVHEDGKTRVDMVFVANRPQGILNLSLDPIKWGLTLADFLSLGLGTRLLEPVQRLVEPLTGSLGEVDPVYAFIDAVNALSGGQAAQRLCISREELDRQFLLKHYMQHYQTLVGALRTWRQFPDWLNPPALPEWVVMGMSS
jgi:hypothetical protein